MIKIKDLLKYRSICMALAIVWVVYMHTDFDLTGGPLLTLRIIGYGGVDIFVFVSGIGCFCSFFKNPDVYEFLKKRFIKLAPLYWIVLIPWMIFKRITVGMTYSQMLGDVLFIQEFTMNDCSYSWYITAMWLYYFLVPIFYAILLKTKKKSGIAFIIIILTLMSLPFAPRGDLLIMVIRIVLFFIGMYVGKLAMEDKSLNKLHCIVLIFACLLGGAILRYFVVNHNNLMSNYGMWWYPFILITPGLCLVICLLSCWIDKIKVGSFLLKGVSYVGNHTYEIFLMHLFVYTFIRHFIFHGYISGSYKTWFVAVLMVIVSSWLLILVGKGINYQMKKISDKRKK